MLKLKEQEFYSKISELEGMIKTKEEEASAERKMENEFKVELRKKTKKAGIVNKLNKEVDTLNTKLSEEQKNILKQ